MNHKHNRDTLTFPVQVGERERVLVTVDLDSKRSFSISQLLTKDSRVDGTSGTLNEIIYS